MSELLPTELGDGNGAQWLAHERALAAAIADFDGASARIRYASSWTDDDGESYGGYWYAEMRRRDHLDRMIVVTLDMCDDVETWREILSWQVENLKP